MLLISQQRIPSCGTVKLPPVEIVGLAQTTAAASALLSQRVAMTQLSTRVKAWWGGGVGIRTAVGTDIHRLFCMVFTLLLWGGVGWGGKVHVWRSEDKLGTLLLSCHLMPIVVGTELGLTGLLAGVPLPAELSAGQESSLKCFSFFFFFLNMCLCVCMNRCLQRLEARGVRGQRDPPAWRWS